MKKLNINAVVTGLALGAGLFAGAAMVPTVTAAPAKAAKRAVAKTVYVCPMHAEVVSLKPGKCPKCKMTLKKKSVKAIYTCPMHPKVLALKPGKCPICKMTLKKK